MATIPIRCSMVSILVMRGSGDATQVLLVQRAGEYLRGVWSYVGGHIEAGELAWRSALRELHEETRLIRSGLRCIGFRRRAGAIEPRA